MGLFEQGFYAVLLTITVCGFSVTTAGHISEISQPTSITLPIKDETTLTCEMNLTPDTFQWRYYPLGASQASNPKAPLDLSTSNYIDPQNTNITNEKKISNLMIRLTNYSMAGDYQCLAHYGTSIFASIPDRITVTKLEKFPIENDTHVTVSIGNTILWRCEEPFSNPPAYIDYVRNGVDLRPLNPLISALIISNVTKKDSGVYRCKATNTLLQTNVESLTSLHLNVVEDNLKEAPKFLFKPKSSYVAQKGETIFFECGAVGTPVPHVIWKKRNGVLPANRTNLLPGGLQIINITKKDQGIYICKYANIIDSISHEITLTYIDPPKVTLGSKKIPINPGEAISIECNARGSPEPQINWFLNGKNILNVANIVQSGNQIKFSSIQKSHAGIIQCFANNIAGVSYSSAELILADDEMSAVIPPSKPVINRLNDEAVVIRWSIPNTNGLKYFKVQYKEVKNEKSNWQAIDTEVPLNIRSFEIANLKTDQVYKFRILAIGIKNDILSAKSDKFLLTKEESAPVLPIPKLLHAESISSSSIQINWECPTIDNVTIDGYFIGYSVNTNYMKVAVDGQLVNSFVITHLNPETIYSIKIQSFNSKGASGFSSIIKQATDKAAIDSRNKSEPHLEQLSHSTLYISIVLAVVCCRMMGSFEQSLCAVLLTVSVCGFSFASERVYKISEPTSITVPFKDETTLTCEMNLTPDKFQWRYYPLGKSEASNQTAPLDMSKSNYIDLQNTNVKIEKKVSNLLIKLTNYSMAGDYQCLAHYGASVVASIPDRITITTLEKFPPQNSTYITVTAGNTILWKCDPPISNPPAYIDYLRNGTVYHTPYPSINSLIISNVTRKDSGTYKCKATNTLLQKYEESPSSLHLHVVQYGSNEMPRFLFPPKSTYIAQRGETVFFECGTVGTPVPHVTWKKIDGVLHTNRTELLPGGLRILNITREDQGVYMCKHTNKVGAVSHQITLIYSEAPEVNVGPKSIHIKEGDPLDLECNVKGYPNPQITWLLNGKSVLSDKGIEAVGNIIYFSPIEKRHAGIIQCFATNSVGTAYSIADLNVIPKQISSTNVAEDFSTLQPAVTTYKRKKHKGKHKHKGTSEMIPPGKPTISRLNDESVIVRWAVPNNDGLPIQFFKVQYKELGPGTIEEGFPRRRSSGWKTANLDVAPNIRSFEVNNLKPDHIYKFRIAAVYSNNDNKLSPKSDKFHLTRADFFARNPLPIPKLTHTETINSTSVRIYWEYIPNHNVTIDGYFISYMSASSAGDYMKATVDGEKANSYVITHLTPDTVYDIKMQSFNAKSASEFSPILKQKTEKLATESPVTTSTNKSNEPLGEHAPDSSPYVFIIVAVVFGALTLSIIVFLIICRKFKHNEDTDSARGDRSDKPAVEEINHHIQADSNDYVVLARSNGCAIPPNRITITANPLADADNKSQNMIEMSCLSSQNNNCSTASASTQEGVEQQQQQQPEQSDAAVANAKGKHKNKRRKQNSDPPSSGENYV